VQVDGVSMSAKAQSKNSSGQLTVRDLARRDTGLGVPGGKKADFIIDTAQENMDMTVTEFSRNVIGQQIYESYIREVLEEAHPASLGITDINEHEFI